MTEVQKNEIYTKGHLHVMVVRIKFYGSNKLSILNLDHPIRHSVAILPREVSVIHVSLKQTCAFRLAPSRYTCPPCSWIKSQMSLRIKDRIKTAVLYYRVSTKICIGVQHWQKNWIWPMSPPWRFTAYWLFLQYKTFQNLNMYIYISTVSW